MSGNAPKSRTARAVRSQGHKASGGHSLHRNRIERDPNSPPVADHRHHHKEHPMTEFKEYPKLLHFEGKPSVRVLSRDEEDAVLAGHAGHKPPKAEKAPKAATEHSGVSRKDLIAKAKAAGVKKANFLTTEELLKQVG